MRGFSLMEFILVMAIMILIASLSLPLYYSFYSDQLLESTADQLTSDLRLIQGRSLAGEQNSAWGIRFSPGQYTLFAQTDSAFDEIFNYSPRLNITADTELLFQAVTGQPSTPTAITLIDDNLSRQIIITINAQGLITKQ